MNSLIVKLGNTLLRSACRRTNKITYPSSIVGSEISRSYAYHYPDEKKYDPKEAIDYKVSKDPEEWKFVTRLLPSKWINDPVPKESYPSGWKPPDPAALSLPYYVRRSKNHMIPVYMKILNRGQRKLTFIRHICGDIWLFHEDIKKYIEDKCGKEIGVKVDEVGCKLVIRGDYAYYATEWIKEKGF
uniref:Large ribosomal subunit protein mL49 n=1 Tax=Panstrongylus lignarius TaxID=156445 RepID=A0A224XYN9_9HEMI